MIPGVLHKKSTRTFLVSFFIAVLVSLLMFAGFFDTWESKISDALYTPGSPLEDIVIVAIDDESLQELGRWPWPRDRFSRVLGYLNQSSVIGMDLSFFEPAEGDDELAKALKKGRVVLAMEYTSFSHKQGELYGESLLKPTSSLGTADVDYRVGFVNLYTDSDGITRSFPPHISGIENHDHFSLVIVDEFLGIPPPIPSARMLIKFYATPGGYTHISFSDVYNNRTHPSYFKDKIVLIGATAKDLHDDVNVPISSQSMPGVEVNANLVQSILTRDYLAYQDDVSALVIIFLFAFLMGLLLFRFKIYIATGLVFVIVVLYVLFSIYMFQSGTIMNILYPFLSLAGVYIGLMGLYYITEEKKRKWITSVFGKYVSPLVIDNLIKNPDRINLGGEKRNITLFFSDIRGFTSISEKFTPEELIDFLNEYLNEMTKIIMKHQGLVDKYMGDAIMAFWGAPLDQPNHAERACLSGLEMIEKLGELKKRWEKMDMTSFNIGIGINSGDAIVGNIGSNKRLDYTALGDNVNIASRLEGLNKIYGTNIIMGENTQRIIKDKFMTRKLDTVTVKGRKKPIFIYELIEKREKASKKQIDFIKLYEEGLEYYCKREWKNAIKSFQAAIHLRSDRASDILMTRCIEFQKNPPASDWDNVWEIQTK